MSPESLLSFPEHGMCLQIRDFCAINARGNDKRDVLCKYIFIRRIRVVANSASQLNHFHPPVRLCSCTSAAPTGRISVKFDMEDFNDGLSDKTFGAFYVKTKVRFIVPGDIQWP
jgi:hypothetical protein